MFKSEHDMREAGTWDESQQTVTDTICPYCGVGCDLELHVQDNAIVKVTSPSTTRSRAATCASRAASASSSSRTRAPKRPTGDGLPEVAGVVLAGGRSTRFGRDKLAEPYRGMPLLHHAVLASGRGVSEVDRRARARRARAADADRRPGTVRARPDRGRGSARRGPRGVARRRDRVRPGHRRRHAGPADPGPARDAAGGGGGRRRRRGARRTARASGRSRASFGPRGRSRSRTRCCTTVGGPCAICSTRCGSP